MKTIALLVLSLLVVATAPGCKKEGSTSSGAGGDSVDALAGKYEISEAVNPGGAGGYTGKVTLTRMGSAYQIAWAIPNSPPYGGVGIPVGNTLAVGWGMGAQYGVVVYQVNGGTLKGQWATAKSPALGSEDLEGPPGLNGSYKITKAAGPDGKSYEGTVIIQPRGEAFDVTWTLPGESYSGVGIQEGDLLVVGWGDAGKGAGVVSYKISGKTLVGRWGTPGSDWLGTESLTKE